MWLLNPRGQDYVVAHIALRALLRLMETPRGRSLRKQLSSSSTAFDFDTFKVNCVHYIRFPGFQILQNWLHHRLPDCHSWPTFWKMCAGTRRSACDVIKGIDPTLILVATLAASLPPFSKHKEGQALHNLRTGLRIKYSLGIYRCWQ